MNKNLNKSEIGILHHGIEKQTIEKVVKYGTEVWADIEMDKIRKERCLCFNCGIKECSTARTLYQICCDKKMAMMITRCLEYIAKK
jgi:hypothetical protein